MSTNGIEALVERSSRGGANEAEAAIHDAATMPGLFAFGELQDTAGVAKLRERGGDSNKSINLLDVLCYGTLSDYRSMERRNAVPQLSGGALTKLRQLTVASLARKGKDVAYSALTHSLELPSDSELEDFIVDEVLTAGVVSGRLNQEKRLLEVYQVIPRDVQPETASDMADALSHWLSRARNAVSAMEHAAGSLDAMVDEAHRRDEWLEKTQQRALHAIESKRSSSVQDEHEVDRSGAKRRR